MALRVNPTRMELSRTKKRLKTAVRGHKLLKDKQDEMIRRFVVYIRRNRALRLEVEDGLHIAMGQFAMASADMGPITVQEALMVPARSAQVNFSVQNIMGVQAPKITYKSEASSRLPYGFAFTSGRLDMAVQSVSSLLPKLIELAEVEKICELLSDAIEKTRRRVNALEHIMIPQLKDTIHNISMKLEDNERGNITRLMKVKDMIEQQKMQ
ncbi:MAG: V-type ATP synthase subunit D [Christensenellales bacterium]